MLTQVEANFDKGEFLKGLGLNQSMLGFLKVCVVGQEDAKRFEEIVENNKEWYMRQCVDETEFKKKGFEANAKSFAVMQLREEKISNNPLSFEEFQMFYEIDPVEALQMLFWEEVHQEDVNKYMPRWFAQRTLKDIYEKHMKSPYDRFMSYVL